MNLVRRRIPGHLGALLGETLLWGVPVALFLAVYVGVFHRDEGAVWEHVKPVTLYLVGVLLLRWVAHKTLGERIAAWVVSALTATAIMLLVCYYILVVIGLVSWRRVMTLPLLNGYVRHLDQLGEALQVNSGLVFLAIALIFIAAIFAIRVSVIRFDWLPALDRAIPTRLSWPTLTTFAMAWSCVVYSWASDDHRESDEPVAVTFLMGGRARPNLQSHSVRTDADSVRRELDARRSYAPSQNADRRNVVLIVVDALRADRMGIFGFERQTTPHLQARAAAGQLRMVKVARAVCAETACGMMGILSGRYVHEFVASPFILQEVLQQHSYRLRMILSGDHVNFYGLAKAYGAADTYVDGSMLPGYVNDDRQIVDYVRSMPHWDKQPVMLQFHLMTTHCLGRKEASFKKYVPGLNGCLGTAVAAEKMGQAVLNYYDNGVLQVDAILDKLISELERKGYLDNALVVIVGDHGEYLGEHGRFRHAHGVHEPVLRIPFLLMAFGYKPETEFLRDSVTQADFAPTILRELRMPIPATWTGIPAQERVPGRLTYFQQGLDFGLIDERVPGQVWKYWQSTGSGTEFAFELVSDPVEQNNRILSVPPSRRFEWFRIVAGNRMTGGATQEFPDLSITGK